MTDGPAVTPIIDAVEPREADVVRTERPGDGGEVVGVEAATQAVHCGEQTHEWVFLIHRAPEGEAPHDDRACPAVYVTRRCRCEPLDGTKARVVRDLVGDVVEEWRGESEQAEG